MQKKQFKQKPVLLKTLRIIFFVWPLVASAFVFANERYYIYPSDIIQGKRNNIELDEQGKWQYKYEIPINFQDNNKDYQSYYNYPPPTQDLGSNPITNPQKYLLPSNYNAEINPYASENHYNYSPSTYIMQRLIY